ncbi:hypothetical protein PVAP13_9KG277413 [Panicum virgatum]|uniref:Uncharacterized protein n=1 Tax=Panicum virgatum TaxID=38727 RepID=A0A8T0NRX6_PANVG|nr:hypothetical protein PVAP13_9KG277413 [Panicum virgatum]
MLLLDPETGEYSDEKTPSCGKDTLEQFFERVISDHIFFLFYLSVRSSFLFFKCVRFLKKILRSYLVV